MKIVLYSSTGCPYCEKIKNDLKNWGYGDFEERNVSDNPDYFNDLHDQGIFSTPVTFVGDEPVIGYRPNKMKSILGVDETKLVVSNTAQQTDFKEELFSPILKKHTDEVYDLVCIGAGPAGASAAVYAARGNMKTLVIDKSPQSGTLAITHKIANYPGVREELTGLELLERIQYQAKDFGADFVRGQVLEVDFSGDIKQLITSDGVIQAKSVFIGVGAKAPNSKIPGEEEFTGRGVSYCSTCDAAFYKGKIVAVVGDTEEAVAEALALSKFAEKVKFLIPGKSLKGDVTIDEVQEKDNIEVFWSHKLREIVGEKKIERIIVQDNQRQKQEWQVDGVFLYMVGLKPGTDFLGQAVKRDSEGFIEVDELLQTSVDGVFAGGDARRTPIKQAVISAADGAIAAMGADKHVNKRKAVRAQYS